MDGKDFVEGLLRTQLDGLKLMLGLLDISFFDLLVAKIKEFFSETGGFQDQLRRAVARYNGYRREELILQLLLRLNHELGLPAYHYSSRKDFWDNAEDLIAKTLEAVRQADKDFRGSSLEDLFRHTINKLFAGLSDADEEKKSRIIQEILRFVSNLSSQEQERLKQGLGVEALTSQTIRRALETGTLGVGLAALVHLGGFSFYTALSSLIAAVAGSVGLTLPFAVYVGASSLFAVLANPLFLIPALTSGGYILCKRQNATLKNRLLGLIVVLLALNFEGESADMQLLLKEWEAALNEYGLIEDRLNREKMRKQSLERQCHCEATKFISYEQALKSTELQIAELQREIIIALDQDEILLSLSTVPFIRSECEAIMETYSRIMELHRQKAHSRHTGSIGDIFKRLWKDLRIAYDLSCQEQQKRMHLENLVKKLETEHLKGALPKTVVFLKEKLEVLTRKRAEAAEHAKAVSFLNQKIKDLTGQIQECEAAVKRLEEKRHKIEICFPNIGASYRLARGV